MTLAAFIQKALRSATLTALLIAFVRAAADAEISLDVRDLDIYDAVRLLATQANANVVVDSSVPHRAITLRLQHVSFDDALATLATSNDLAAVRVGGVVYVGTTEAINRRYPSGSSLGSRTQIFALRNGNSDDAVKDLSAALPPGTLVVGDKRTASVIVTGSPNAIERARTLIASLDQSDAPASASVPMRFVRSNDALDALHAVLPPSPTNAAYANAQQNAILLSGSDDFVAHAKALLDQIDRPGQQVRYDVKVTDVTPQSDASNVGVIFGGVDFRGGLTSGSTVYTFQTPAISVNATLNALVTEGRATILARPSISTLNNQQASLLVGQSYPIVYFDARTGTQQVQFVNVGVNLTVTPTIGFDGAITTELSTDYSQFVSFVSNFPVIGTRKAQSTLRVRDGETIVIAGLFSDVDQSTVTKVPFLGDIPILGEIFKNRQHSHTKDEIVFLITPHLVRDQTPDPTPQGG